jgi:Arc/MetJ-type ribon-helix-helix transcriptional regulator
MAEFHITLPDDAATYVQELISQGEFASPSEVVVDALGVKRRQAAQARLAELIREGLECEGADIEYTDEWWENRMDQLKQEAERRRSA